MPVGGDCIFRELEPGELRAAADGAQWPHRRVLIFTRREALGRSCAARISVGPEAASRGPWMSSPHSGSTWAKRESLDSQVRVEVDMDCDLDNRGV